MKIILRFLALFILVFYVNISCTWAQQAQTGFPPFGSFGGDSFDTVNLQNLDVHLTIPIMNKPGRGLPVALSLNYDGLIWTASNSCGSGCGSWEAPIGFSPYDSPNSLTSWGWSFSPGGFVTQTPDVESYCYTGNPPVMSGAIIAYFYSYYDRNGTLHSFPFPIATETGTCGSASSGTPGTATDGSGLTLTVQFGVSATVTDPHGRTFYFEAEPSNTNYFISPVETDTNGNQITDSSHDGTGLNYNDTLTDTLGQPVLAVAGAGTSSSPVTITYTDPNGDAATYTVKYTSYTVKTNFGCTDIVDYGPTQQYLVSEIDLPDQGTIPSDKYTFTYEATPSYSSDVTARLASVTVPTGGTISFVYPGGTNGTGVWCTNGTPAELYRYTPDTGSNFWTYSSSTTPGTVSTTTVTDPQGNQTVVTFPAEAVEGSTQYYEAERQVYQGSSSGTPIETVYTCYNGASPPPCSSFGTTPPQPFAGIAQKTVYKLWSSTSQESEVNTLYDTEAWPSGYNGYHSYGLTKEQDEYDYGSGSPGSPIRKTLTTYANLSNGILDRPSSVTVENGSGSTVALTNYSYDGASPVSSGITTQHISVSGSRGNLTGVSRWLSTTNTYLNSSNTYFDTGMLDVATDARGYSSETYSYSSAYVGAYPTTITNALGQTDTYTYDINTGLVKTHKDANGQTTTYAYNSLLHPTQINYPDGGETTYNYPSPTEVDETETIGSGLSPETSSVFADGLGRVKRTAMTSDPSGTVYVDTTYDALGRVYSVSNPYRSTSDPTYGITTYNTYDPLNRLTLQTDPDGSQINISYSGSCSTVTDEAGINRKSCTDGAGRLNQVVENPDGTSYTTTYSYNQLDDLTAVNQSNLSRSFSYDSLSRLTSAQNPESGTVSYGYDPNGNLTSRVAPQPNQSNPSVTVTTTYGYDAANRLTSKTYSNSTQNPSITYSYDSTTCVGVSSCYNIGRRTGIIDGAGSSAFSYDPMGRLAGVQRTTNSVTKTNSATYYLQGSLKSVTYPSGLAITYQVGADGRPTSATDQSNNTYASSATYAPQGALATLTLGRTSSFAGINVNRSYNDRLEPSEFKASSATGNATDLVYGYPSGHNNGNISQVTNNLDGTRSQTYGYDPFNRIMTAGTTSTYSTSPTHCWGETYEYDTTPEPGGPWGNLTNINQPSTYNGCMQESGLSLTEINNQLSSYGYDAPGNLTSGGNFGTLTYNDEGQIISAGGVNYLYDGDGNRVEKTNQEIYWYGTGGQILDESDSSGNITGEYVFFNRRRTAHIVTGVQ
jgi:YD repeat-containing protein